MKKSMTLKNERKTEHRKRQNVKVDTESLRILRTVGDKDAFYFYEAVGKPTGEVAKNLSDFLDRVKSAKAESLIFHLQRRDFQNWVEKILGDSKLAKKLGSISPTNSDGVRTNIYRIVENRIRELRESSAEIHVDANAAVLIPSV
ncbi:hypothetical protein HXY33_02920 [Candidatus Bathyarchaeota archaeon]|nr:hypothetical protein [Candidatus Bathyarchaeota archaeon]